MSTHAQKPLFWQRPRMAGFVGTVTVPASPISRQGARPTSRKFMVLGCEEVIHRRRSHQPQRHTRLRFPAHEAGRGVGRARRAPHRRSPHPLRGRVRARRVAPQRGSDSRSRRARRRTGSSAPCSSSTAASTSNACATRFTGARSTRSEPSSPTIPTNRRPPIASASDIYATTWAAPPSLRAAPGHTSSRSHRPREARHRKRRGDRRR